jgi:hypothetical protein
MPDTALLALALEIEERVVHADGHPHQQHHRARGIGSVNEVARQRGETARAEHRGERQQHRQARGDECAKRHQQNGEGDRQRQPLGAREPIVDLLVQLEVGAGVPELRDRKVGSPAL